MRFCVGIRGRAGLRGRRRKVEGAGKVQGHPLVLIRRTHEYIVPISQVPVTNGWAIRIRCIGPVNDQIGCLADGYGGYRSVRLEVRVAGTLKV